MSDEKLVEKITDAVEGLLAKKIDTLLKTGSVNDITNVLHSITSLIDIYSLNHFKGKPFRVTDLDTI